MGAGHRGSHPSQGGQPFLWEPSFHRAVDPGAVPVTGQGLAKKCGYGGPVWEGGGPAPQRSGQSPVSQGSQCREASMLTKEDLGLA